MVAQEHPSCPFVELGKGGSTPVPASSHHTPGCHKPQAGFLCFLPHKEESGECYTSPGVPPSSGVSTSVKAVDAPVLCAEITVLLAKDAIELVPPADMRSGFYSPYFIVPKKSGGL